MMEQWVVKISREREGDDRVHIRREVKGRIIETYAPVDADRGALYMSAIIHGYQPPRYLHRLDKPFD